MEELIKRIGSWEIIKLLGGAAVILVAVVYFVSQILLARITQASQHYYNKDVEKVKSDFEKRNGLLHSVVDNFLTSSDKTFDKRIEAYGALWKAVLNVKSSFPSGVALIYQLFSDAELESPDAFQKVNSSSQVAVVLRSYKLDDEMVKFVEHGKALLEWKPYLSDTSYKLFYTIQGLIGRVTHNFIEGYAKGVVYNWKKDKHLLTILRLTLTDEEVNHMLASKVLSVESLINLIEYKVLQDFRTSLNISGSTDDTLEYVNYIETYFSNMRDMRK